MRKLVQCRRSITRTASRVGVEVERLEQRFAMAVDCGCGAAVDPTVAPTEPEPAALVVPPEASAARSQDVQFAQAIDTRRLPVPTSGAVSAVRRGWLNSPVARSLSRNEPRQVAGGWRAGAYLGGKIFKSPFPETWDCESWTRYGRPCLSANSISFRLGPDLQGRPNVLSQLRISFAATLIAADGRLSERHITFSDEAPEPLRDDIEITPVLDLVPGRRDQTFEFQVRGGFNNDFIFVVELKLNWNNKTKRFTASMKATSDLIEGQYLQARTYPAGTRGVVLASGPARVVRDAAGVIVGASGAVRRTRA